MTLNLDEIERVAREATPGPWTFHEDRYGNAFNDADGNHVCFAAPCATENSELVISPADAAFIAALHPAAVLELVAEVLRLRAALKEACDGTRSPVPA